MEVSLFWLWIFIWGFTLACIGWVWTESNLRQAKEDLNRERRWRENAEDEVLRLQIKIDGLRSEKERLKDHAFTQANIVLDKKVKDFRKKRKEKNVRSK